MTGPVVLTSFTSTMLLKRTRPQAQVSTSTAIEILKLGSLLDAYSIDRIGIPARNGLSRRGCSTTLIRSRKAPHTLLGHCRPPDHERKPQSESWRVGITPISPWVSYPPCVIDSFVPFCHPRPVNSLSPRIYSTFCLANCPCLLLRSSTLTIVPSL